MSEDVASRRQKDQECAARGRLGPHPLLDPGALAESHAHRRNGRSVEQKPSGAPGGPTRGRRAVLVLAAALAGATGLTLWRGAPTALVFLGCAAATLILLPTARRLARRFGAVALPGGRDIHELPTPLIGGAALFLPVAGTLLVVGLMGDVKAFGLLVGGSIVFTSGLLDDLRGISARLKILAQLLAGVALLIAGFRLPGFGIPDVGVLATGPGIVGIGALLFWVVLATNALNLSDGIDGLATSLAILGLGVLAAAGVGGLLPVALAGACLGFLYYNLPRARIFLGDGGSLLLGFLLAALVLELPARANVPLAVAVLSYSLGDVTLAVARRFIRGKPLFAPDRSHVHHKAVHYLGSPLRALIAVLCMATLHASLLLLWPGVASLLICGAMWLFVAVALLKLGHYEPANVLGGRRPMRRLHLLQRYVACSLELATSRVEVEQALQHLAEATAVDSLGVAGLRVASRDATCVHDRIDCACEDVPVALSAAEPHSAARFCTWSAASTMGGATLDQERETIMASLLRQAARRLDSLDRSSIEEPRRSARPCQTVFDLDGQPGDQAQLPGQA